MSSWGVALRSLLPNVGGGPETAALASKEMDTVELYEMLMHLGLSVCLADPGECAGVVRGFARSEASALRCLSRLIIPALSSCTNICVSGVGGQQMCAVEGILSAFLLSTSDGALAPESALAEHSSGAPGMALRSSPWHQTLNNPACISQNTSCEVSTKDSSLPMSPKVKSQGTDRLLPKRYISGDSGSSVGFLRTLLRNQASESTAVTTGDVSWTGDGCPAGLAGDQAKQSRALSKRYANNCKERCERSVVFDVPITGPTSPRDSRRDRGSPWDAEVPPKSLLMFFVLSCDAASKAAPAQGMQQLPLGMHAKRVTSECSSVATTALLDLASGYHEHKTRIIGSLDSLEEMTNEQLSTPTLFGRNVEKTALEQRRASEVTYGVLLRQQQVGDKAANTPSTCSCGGGSVGSSSGVAAGGHRSGWHLPLEYTTAAESVLDWESPCSSNGVSFASSACEVASSTCAQDQVDGETPHEKWRRKKTGEGRGEECEPDLDKANKPFARFHRPGIPHLPRFVVTLAKDVVIRFYPEEFGYRK